MKNTGRLLKVAVISLMVGSVQAAEKTIEVHHLNTDVNTHGIGEKSGTITFEDTKNGLKIKTHLQGLSAGPHGFHVHENPSCEGAEKEGKYQAGIGAGDHLDPQHTGKHLGPYKKGHLGDLPVLVANKKGEVNVEKIAPHLTVAEIENHSVIIHKGGDNYSDNPKMGGGGDRIACGVIK